MGLTVSHNCFDGPYSTFNRFRYSLAYQIGINLDDYIGYGESGFKKLETINHPLMDLFNHSDCDGRLTVLQSKKIVKGFDLVLENFQENGKYDFNFKEMINEFKDGLSVAISKKQVVKFR